MKIKFILIFLLIFELSQNIKTNKQLQSQNSQIPVNSAYHTVVLLVDNNLSLIKGDKVWNYVLSENVIKKYANNGPKLVSDHEDYLPHSITGYLEIEDGKYYFFRENRYCVRKIESGKHEISYEEEEEVQVYQLDKNGNKKMVSLNNLKNNEITTLMEPKSKCVWKSNTKLFGCVLVKGDNSPLYELCQKPWVTGVIGYKNNIYVLGENKVYQFDGKFTALNPLGKLVTNNFDLHSIWKKFDPKHGSYFTYNDNLYVITDNKAYTKYAVDGSVEVSNGPINLIDANLNRNGAPVLMPNNKVSVILGHQAFSFITIKEKLFKANENNVIAVDKTPYRFPNSITGAFSADSKEYTLFRGSSYCKRDLKFDNKAYYEEHTYNEVYKLDSEGNTQQISSSSNGSISTSGYKSSVSHKKDPSMCNWKDNKELFGCGKKADPKLKTFCANAYVYGILIKNSDVYVIGVDNVYVFDSALSKLKSTISFKDIFKGYEPKQNGFIYVNDKLYLIYANETIVLVDKNETEKLYTKPMYDKMMATTTTTEKAIQETPDQPEGDMIYAGAVIADNHNVYNFKVIQKDNVMNLVYTKKQLWIKDKYKPNTVVEIVAVIQTDSSHWYFINKDGKYCKSIDNNYEKCNQWYENNRLFGCRDGGPKLRSLCANSVITAGANIGPHIFVFRNGKYWEFDNKPKPTKLFGDLVESAALATNKWKTIKLPGALTLVDGNLVVIRGNVYSEWSSMGKPIITDRELVYLEAEVKDEPEGSDKDGGAVIPVSGKLYAKVNKEKVCYVLIKLDNKKTTWSGECHSVKDDVMNYPKNIVAAVIPQDNHWYFITNDGKYCRRENKTSKPCIDWKDLKVLLGCNKKTKSGLDKGLQSLCINSVISSGTNCGNSIYLFRGGNYWLFDGKSESDRPLGKLLCGPKPAKQKWPKIHFPAGFTCDKQGLTAVYNNHWSHWSASGANEVDSNIKTSNECSVNKEEPVVINEPITEEELDDDEEECDDGEPTEAPKKPTGPKRQPIILTPIDDDDTDTTTKLPELSEVASQERTTTTTSTKKPEEEEEEPEQEIEPNDPNSGALICQTDGKIIKIKGQLVCYYTLKDNKLKQLGKCVDVNEDPNRYPPNIVAALQTPDKMWYFFRKDGKHCRRPSGSKEECNIWTKNKLAFGCQKGGNQPMNSMQEALCNSPLINAGGSLSLGPVVFKGGKYYQFDNKQKEGQPMGTVTSGNDYAKSLWSGIKFPGGVCQPSGAGNGLLIVYDKKYSNYLPNNKPVKIDEPIDEGDRDRGAAVVLPNNMIAVVIGNKVWFYKKLGNKICKASKMCGSDPQLVNNTREKLPIALGASFSLNNNVYYFFRGSQYCKRPLIVDEDTHYDITIEMWSQTVDKPKELRPVYMKPLDNQEKSKYFSLKSDDPSHCIWRKNSELFGCDSGKSSPEVTELCKNPISIGTVVWDKTDVYFFTTDRVYALNARASSESDIKGSDKLFLNIRNKQIVPSKTWQGFDVNYGQFFSIDGQMCAIKDNSKYKCWDSKGNLIGKEEEICAPDEEMADLKLGGDTNPAAFIESDSINGNYELIKNGKSTPMIMDDGKLEEVDIDKTQTQEKYPNYLIGVIQTSDQNWYYIKNDGTYCKKLDLTNKECNEWKDIKGLLGCDAKTVRCDLQSLCNKPKIKGAVVCDEKIYVYRGGKYWTFDNKPAKNKPIGQLIEGPLPALSRWPHIILPSAMGCKEGQLIVVANDKWSKWDNNGSILVKQQPIGKAKSHNPDDLGALVPIDGTDPPKYARVSGNKVCYLIMRYNRFYYSGQCLPVTKDNKKFPPNIVAAIKTNDDIWYFLDRNGKYCKRPVGNHNECKDWKPNTEVFGCKAGESNNKELQTLCKAPTVSAGGNGPINIYVFKNDKYWEFDNKPKVDKPFGELVSGNKPFKDKWKGLHVPGGINRDPKNQFTIVHDKVWSRWPHKDDDEKDEEESAALEKEGKTKKMPKKPTIDEPIRPEEVPDDGLRDEKDFGALINPQKSGDKYQKVKKDRVCSYVLKNNTLYNSGLCEPVAEEKHNYPPNIIASIKSADNIWYYINRFGKYCKRKDADLKSCSSWLDSREIFGCNSLPVPIELENLCDNSTIDSGGNLAKHIIVFRGGKYWEFDNIPKKEKPFGNLVTGTVVAKRKWPGIYFPGGVGHDNDHLMIVYDTKWSKYSPNGEIEVDNEPILDEIICAPTAVLLPGSRVAVVDKDNVWFYRKKGDKIIKDGKDNGPMKTKFSTENFPEGLCAAMSTNNIVYYFFKSNKYCKRPLKIALQVMMMSSMFAVGPTIENDVYESDWFGEYPGAKSKKLSESEAAKYFSPSVDSYCIWRDISELLDCKTKNNMTKDWTDLCANPQTTGSLTPNQNTIYYISANKKTVDFGIKPQTEAPDRDKRFDNLKPEPIDLEKIYPEFKPSEGRFVFIKGQLCVIYEKTYKCWNKDSNGLYFAINKKIGEHEEESPDEPEGDPKDAGALINIDPRNAKYVNIKGKNICYYVIEENKMYFDGKCLAVKEDKTNYPTDIIAAIKSKTNEWYFIRIDGKYCSRHHMSIKECTEWRDNKELFICDDTNKSPEHESLCNNLNITSGGNFPPDIYVFRNGKYWQFDNRPQKGKPLGDLVDGAAPAKQKWPGMHLPGGFAHNMENPIIVYDKKWSQWKPNGDKDVEDEPIEHKIIEIPDDPEDDPNDSGALIPTDPTKEIFAKIVATDVCYIKFKGKRVFWMGKCKSVKKDENNFPPNIIAAIKAKDNNWYYFDSNGKFCKRPDKNYQDCTKWESNNLAFGCIDKSEKKKIKNGDNTQQQELELLCKNLMINAGGNYPPHIFVFRGGKYWQFDNKPKPDKPFGELVAGQVPAKNKWPGIRFPNGFSHIVKDAIAVYRKKYSRWTPKGKRIDGNIKKPGDKDLPDEEETGDPNERDKKKNNKAPNKKGNKKGDKKDKDDPDEEETDDPNERDRKKNNETDEPDEEEAAALERDPKKASQSPKAVDQPIEDEEMPDEPDGDPSDTGAIFNDDPNPDVRANIKGDQVCQLLFRENKLYRIGKCVSVDEDKHSYPPDLVAVIQNKDKDWFFVNTEGKYCKRKDKNYEKCTDWKDNPDLFGCEANKRHPTVDNLCRKPKISAGGNHPPNILVFRGGKRWTFDNQPEQFKPFGNIVEGEGEVPAKNKLPGIHFPGGFGHNREKPVMVYNKKWSQWLPNGDADVVNEPILDLNNSPGVSIPLPNDRIAVVVNESVWYYRKKGPKLMRDSHNNGPHPVKDSVESFPPYISAALTLNHNIYYFFKDDKYCKRPLIVDDNSYNNIPQLDWDNMAAKSDETNTDMLNEEEAQKYFKLSPKDSYCIWKDNRELLGCKLSKVNNKIRKLCSNPITIGTVILDHKLINVFTHLNLYVFDPTGKPNKQMEPTFTKLISDETQPAKKWPGFDPTYGRFFTNNINHLCVIIENKRWTCWTPDGKKVVDNKPILPPEDDPQDEEEPDDGNAGALINPEDNKGKFARIRANKVCELSIEDEEMFLLSECLDVSSDPRNFPPHIVAAIKPKDNNWYFFNKEGKYCKRAEKDYNKCKKWSDNKEPFGCLAKHLSPDLQVLCKNVTINGGGNYPPHILVTKGGKYWKFDNRPKPKKPFGDLVEMRVPARDKYPGLHMPGAIGHNGPNFLVVHAKTWSQWLPNGFNDVLDEPILHKDEEIPDQPELNPKDKGALIPINDTIPAPLYAKIKGNKVCYCVIRGNKLFWRGKCVFVGKDKHNFPPYIVAAIKPKPDDTWYFFDDNGKYCKRPDNNYQECNKWSDNREVFGCSADKKQKQELKFLCDNPRINAGTNLPPNILVFRGGKYWKFDNKPKPKKPFGELVEGQVPAKIDYPGIHFPGGSGHQRPDKFIMVYDIKWSRWKPDDTGGRPAIGTDKKPSNGPTDSGKQNSKPKNDEELPDNEESAAIERDKTITTKKPKTDEDLPDNEESAAIERDKTITTKKPKTDKDLPDNQESAAIERDKQPKGGNKDNDVNEDMIRDEDDTKGEVNGKDDDAGALIPIDEMNGRFAKIVDDKTCYITIKTYKAVWSGDCIPVTEDQNNFPPYIIAAILNDDNDWFFFDRNGKYCKRKKNNFETCTEWRPNAEVFGCEQPGVTHELEILCKNVQIKAGTQESPLATKSHTPHIWLFRGGKFWVFDNKPVNDKPFGVLVGGPKRANDLFPGLHMPGGAGFDGPNLIMVYKTKWSRWTPEEAQHALPDKSDKDWLNIDNKKNPKEDENNSGHKKQPKDIDDQSDPNKGVTTESNDGDDDKNKPDGDGGKNKPGDDEDKNKPDGDGGKNKPDGGNNKPGDDGTDNKPDKGDHQPSSNGNDVTPSGSGEVLPEGFERPKDIFEQKIEDEDNDMPKIKSGSQPDGALINIDPKRSKYAKVMGDQVCHYIVRDKKCYRNGNCTDVSADKHNFPPNIVAAIKAKDDNWYFIHLNGQYCKRHVNNVEDCNKWSPLQTIIGCDTMKARLNFKYRYLCRNPKLSAGANYEPYIYLFKDGMYWKFNNNYTPKKPFGDLIDGGDPAREKWPGIHFPGGTSWENRNFIIIYKNKWSRWKPNGDSPDGQPKDDEPSDETSVAGMDRPKKDKPNDDDNQPIKGKPDDGNNKPSNEDPDGDGNKPSNDGKNKPKKENPDGGDNQPSNEDPDNDGNKPSNGGKNKPKKGKPDGGDNEPSDEVSVAGLDREKNKKSNDGDNQPIKGKPDDGNNKPSNEDPDGDGNKPSTGGQNKPKKGKPDGGDNKPSNEDPDDDGNKPSNGGKNKPKKENPDEGDNQPSNEDPDNDGNKPSNGGKNKPKKGKPDGGDNQPSNEDPDNDGNKPSNGGQNKPSNGGQNKPKKGKPDGGDNEPSDETSVAGLDREKNKKPNDGDNQPSKETPDDPFLIDFKKKVKMIPEINDVGDDPILDEPSEIPDETDRRPGDSGALIPLDNNKSRFAKVSDDQVCYIGIENDTAFWTDPCKSVTDDDNNYPPNIIAYIQPKSKIDYFINKNGEYCSRSPENKKSCLKWRDNKEIFGCHERSKDEEMPIELRYLCNNPVINAGGVYNDIIHVFRGGKQWRFNNKPKDKKPFGDLLDGAYKAKTNWTGIHFPGGVGQWSPNGPEAGGPDNFIIVYKKKWSKYGKPGPQPTAGDIRDMPIDDLEEDDDPADSPDQGALILVDPKRKRYGKIKGPDVCYLYIKKNVAFWDGKCKPVTEDANNFPPDIIAAIHTPEKYWYFVARNGTYCRREDTSKIECTKWGDNKELFGCNSKPLKRELEQLCHNTTINSGGNVEPNVLVFKNGKYWQFDNKPEKGKPIGNLIEGKVPIHPKYDGMHLPGGISHNKDALVIVYQNRWAQWVPEGKGRKADNEDDTTTESDSNGFKPSKGGKKDPDDNTDGFEPGAKSTTENPDGSDSFEPGKGKPSKGGKKDSDDNTDGFEPGAKSTTENPDGSDGFKPGEGKPSKGGKKDPDDSSDGFEPGAKSTTGKPDGSDGFEPGKGKPSKGENPDDSTDGFEPGKNKPSKGGKGGSQPGKDELETTTPNDDFGVDVSKKSKQGHPGTDTDEPTDISEQPILDEPKDQDGDPKDMGALIPMDSGRKRYAKIIDTDVCYVVVSSRGDKAFWDEKPKCKPVTEDANNFPPNIIGAVKTRGNVWYFFDREGKHCNRKNNDTIKCTEWSDNKDIFGCNTDKSTEMEDLCNNPIINSAGNYWPFIYLFRGQRYWMFDNKEQPGKPLGKLMSGPALAADKYPGIHLPGGASYHKTSFIIVYRNKWSLWRLRKHRPKATDGSNRPVDNEDNMNKPGVDGEFSNSGKSTTPATIDESSTNGNEGNPDGKSPEDSKKDSDSGKSLDPDKADDSKSTDGNSDNKDNNEKGGNGNKEGNDNKERNDNKEGNDNKERNGNKEGNDNKERNDNKEGNDNKERNDNKEGNDNKGDNSKTSSSTDELGDVYDQPILDKENDDETGDPMNAGALINLDIKLSRFAKIKGDKVCPLQITYNQTVWIGDCRPVDKDEEKFPPHIVAAIKGRDKFWYYFDPEGKHCKRMDGLRTKCDKWIDNRLVFGCNAEDIRSELETLCENVTITGGGNYPPFVYVFRGSKFWKFDGHHPKPGKPLGDLIKGNEPAKNEFDGILMPGGVSFNKNAFVVVYANTWSQWTSSLKDKLAHKGMRQNDNEVSNAPIGTVTMSIIGEPPDLPDGEDSDRGALIPMDEKKGKYAVVRKKQVCYYKITEDKCSLIGECVKVTEDDNKFPPNLVAVIKDRKKNWYFFDGVGKHCMRTDKNIKKCNKWVDNSEIFGCKAKGIKSSALKSLCSNVKISTGTNFSPFIYVFRGSKYWKFNNRMKDGKPFGDVVEGAKPVKDKWEGMHFPGGVGYLKTSLVMVYKDQWSLWSKTNSIIDSKIETTKTKKNKKNKNKND